MRQLQVLGEPGEQGLEIGRAIERQAKAVQPGDTKETPPGGEYRAASKSMGKTSRPTPTTRVAPSTREPTMAA